MSRILHCISIVVLSMLICGCAPQVTILVPDMMCEEGCAAKVREILSEQPGTKKVVVDFEAKTATVTIGNAESDETFDAEAAVAALVDHGFEHSSLKSAAIGVKPNESANPTAEENPAG
jgi:copper chaperone CopZ